MSDIDWNPYAPLLAVLGFMAVCLLIVSVVFLLTDVNGELTNAFVRWLERKKDE